MKDALNYVKNNQDTLLQLIKDLCKIPSFSHEEKEKAEFIKQWFNNIGMEAIIDEAYNVIVPYDIENKDEITVFAAHIDTVFPDKVGFDCVEKDGKLYGLGSIIAIISTGRKRSAALDNLSPNILDAHIKYKS